MNDDKIPHNLDARVNIDALELINDLLDAEKTKEYATLRISQWVVDEYRDFGQEIGMRKHGVLAERVLIAGLKELRRQYYAARKDDKTNP